MSLMQRIRAHFAEVKKINQQYKNFDRTRKAVRKAMKNPSPAVTWEDLGPWRDQ